MHVILMGSVLGVSLRSAGPEVACTRSIKEDTKLPEPVKQEQTAILHKEEVAARLRIVQQKVETLTAALTQQFVVFFICVTLMALVMLITARILIQDPMYRTISTLLVFMMYCVILFVGVLSYQNAD
jgi:hypothetical protein